MEAAGIEPCQSANPNLMMAREFGHCRLENIELFFARLFPGVFPSTLQSAHPITI